MRSAFKKVPEAYFGIICLVIVALSCNPSSIKTASKNDGSAVRAPTSEGTFTSDGTVQYSTIEGGFFYIQDKSGKVYLPQDDVFKTGDAGRKISFTARVVKDMVTYKMTADVIQIDDLKFAE